MNGLALCSGAGGLEIGLHIAEPGYRTVGYVEREAFAAATLVARMEDAAMDRAPVWDDVATFDGRRWRGCVDLVTAGYPCQPFSAAGKRLGTKDPRHLWPHIRRIIVQVRPEWVFLENVAGHLSLGFDIVHRELSRLGFEVAARLQSAAETGASHERERLFVLARAFGCPPAFGALAHRPRVECDRSRCVGSGRVGYAADGGDELVDADGAAGRQPSQPAGQALGMREAARRVEPGRSGRGPVADSGGIADQRRRESGNLYGPSGDAECEGHQRQRRRDAADGGGEDVTGAVADSHVSGFEGRSRLGDDAQREAAQRGGQDVVDAARVGWSQGWPEPGIRGGWRAAGIADGELGHAVDHGRARSDLHARRWPEGPGAAGSDRPGGELPIYPPGPGERERWAAVIAARPDLAPALPRLRRVADGLAGGMDDPRARHATYRSDRLRLTGNGVVPLAAAAAYRALRIELELRAAGRARAGDAPDGADLMERAP